MSYIQLQHLTFGYGQSENPLFKDVSLTIDGSWKLGLAGRNGRGKTTLLKLLAGLIPTDDVVHSDLTISYFPPDIPDENMLTTSLLDELAAPSTETWKIQRELNLLSVDDDVLWRPYHTLSGGEQTKVLLALLFAQENAFILLDEPTNHLDLHGRKTVANYLKTKQGFMIASHDPNFLDEVIDHILAIEKSQLYLYQGNYTTWRNEKELRDAYQEDQNAQLKSDIKRLKQTAAEKIKWSNAREKEKSKAADSGFVSARAARMMKKSKHLERRMENAIEAKEGLLQDIEKVPPLHIHQLPIHKKELLVCEDFTLTRDGIPLFQPIHFILEKGDRLSLTGDNGTGKTSLLQFFSGTWDGAYTGKVTIYGEMRISLLPQTFEHLRGSLPAFAQQKHLNYNEFLSTLRKLGLERYSFQVPIEELSMGQKKKILLAEALTSPAQLYLWDEPLNYLDTATREQLINLLLTAAPTLLFTEHDQGFLEEIQTKSIHLTK